MIITRGYGGSAIITAGYGWNILAAAKATARVCAHYSKTVWSAALTIAALRTTGPLRAYTPPVITPPAPAPVPPYGAKALLRTKSHNDKRTLSEPKYEEKIGTK